MTLRLSEGTAGVPSNSHKTLLSAVARLLQVIQTRTKKMRKMRSLIWMTQIFSMMKKRLTATRTSMMQMISMQKVVQIRSRVTKTMMGWGSSGRRSISHRAQQQKVLQHLLAVFWTRKQLLTWTGQLACPSMRDSSCACKSVLPSWRRKTWLRRTGSCKGRLAQVRPTLTLAAY